MTNIVFRRAAAADEGAILRLQTEIFSGEQDIPAQEVAAFFDRDPILWCAESDGRIVGAAAAWHEGECIHWGRFVIEKACRGQGVGTKLAEFTFRDLFARGTPRIYMEAREITARIVRTMGGVATGAPTPFFRGTVTPLILEKAAFFRARGINEM